MVMFRRVISEVIHTQLNIQLLILEVAYIFPILSQDLPHYNRHSRTLNSFVAYPRFLIIVELQYFVSVGIHFASGIEMPVI